DPSGSGRSPSRLDLHHRSWVTDRLVPLITPTAWAIGLWVSSLGARYVSVETRDGTEFLIPNEDIITHQVVNLSHRSERVRKVPVRVLHDSFLDQALAVMREAACYPRRVLAVPPPTRGSWRLARP